MKNFQKRFFPTLIVSILFLFGFEGCSSAQKTEDRPFVIPASPLSLQEHYQQWRPTQKFSPQFLSQLDQWVNSGVIDLKVLEYSVLNFLSSSDYKISITDRAITKTREFMKAYSKSLPLAEQRHHVDARVIASLLWVETQLGKYLGKYPVVYSYFVLSTARYPNHCRFLLARAGEIKPGISFDVGKKIADRCESKAKWADEQLAALDEMQRRGVDVFALKGSVAGAIGWPQFIPTSYLQFSDAADPAQLADLFTGRDAIFSVAKFLAAHGYRKDQPETHLRALFEYNRIAAYGEAVLKLSYKL